MSLAAIRTIAVTGLLFLATSAYAAAKTKAQVALGWAFVATWFGMVGLVSGVIWYLVRLDRRTALIADGLNQLNRTLAENFRRGTPNEAE